MKENSISDYVIADSKGEPLAASQFQRVWQYVVVRSTKPRNYYKYVNGESIKYTVTPTLGMTQKNQPQIKYTLDFDVTPHQLRHTYITNLLYAGVDPKTVQYLAGHENSKTTMDIYAKVKYNPIFDSQIYQNTAESLILPGFFSGAFSFYYIVFFLNQIWMIDFYDFSRDCLLSFWISFIFLLVRNS